MLDAARSRLANALHDVFNHPVMFGKPARWARFLDVSRASVTMYQRDRVLPSARVLRLIRDHVATALAPADPVRFQFEEVLHAPVEAVTPLASGVRGDGSLRQYVVRPIRLAFEKVMQMLKPDQQEQVYQSSIELAWRLVAAAETTADHAAEEPWRRATVLAELRFEAPLATVADYPASQVGRGVTDEDVAKREGEFARHRREELRRHVA